MKENSIEEALKKLSTGKKIKMYELLRTFKREGIENFVTTRKKYVDVILSDYKRALKENEIYKKNSEIMSKENLSTSEQLKVEIKENFRLKNQLENNRKEYQETYKDVREELKELKKENEELKADNYELNNRITDLLENIPIQKIEDIIDRINYDIKKTKEIISKNTNIYATYRKNDYQIVRLRAMNTKSLDIKKRLQELIEERKVK